MKTKTLTPNLIPATGWLAAFAVLTLTACLPSASAQAQPRNSPTHTANATPIQVAKGDTTQAKLKALGGKKCKDSDFTCVSLSVPLDHFANGGERIKVMFAVWPASGKRKGMFITAVGGPGGSGISEAKNRAGDLPKALHKNFDIVLFDPRGIGRSGYMDCGAAYNDYNTPPAETESQEHELLKATQEFVKSCLREMKSGDGATLRYYATQQVAEDIEAFRATMGDERIWLLGESYGTQLAQTYAAAHPDRLAALVLDGPVDLQRDGYSFLAERSKNYEDLFVQTLRACRDDSTCARDLGPDHRDLLKVYDAMIKSADQKPIKIKFPDEEGKLISQQLTRQDIEDAISDAIGSENGRMLVQRMLVGAARSNYVPLGRSAGLPHYDGTGYSDQTSDPPADSEAMYYVVDCADNGYFPGTPDQRAQAYLRAGDALDGKVRFSRYTYQNLACTYWPHNGESHFNFDPARLARVPTLIIGASGDSATPPPNAERVHQAIAGSRLIMFEGGEHVMFSRGEKCVDDAVTRFLVDGKLPADAVTACPGRFAEAYIALPPESAKSYKDALEAMRSFEDQIFALPDYLSWDGSEDLTLGCDAGGSLTIALDGNDTGDAFTLQDCAFAKGFALSGQGSFNTDSGEVTFTADVSGDRAGQLSYTHVDGAMRVNGKLDGKTVKIKRDDP